MSNSVKYNMSRYFSFTVKFTLIFLVTYLILGTLFYVSVTYKYFSETGAFASFLVGEENPELWNTVRAMMVPVQIIRGILLSSFLYIFYDQLLELSYKKRMLLIWAYITIVAGLASGLPAPGNIEGLLFMKPVITLKIHCEIFLELILQGFVFSVIFSKWIEIKGN